MVVTSDSDPLCCQHVIRQQEKKRSCQLLQSPPTRWAAARKGQVESHLGGRHVMSTSAIEYPCCNFSCSVHDSCSHFIARVTDLSDMIFHGTCDDTPVTTHLGHVLTDLNLARCRDHCPFRQPILAASHTQIPRLVTM